MLFLVKLNTDFLELSIRRGQSIFRIDFIFVCCKTVWFLNAARTAGTAALGKDLVCGFTENSVLQLSKLGITIR